ncbi:hypothetical protein [Mailhella sp.]|uniref:hypothetical protein n=1 Tax=Mailhella sp. TaxID=1981029 RepID=UPI004063AF85
MEEKACLGRQEDVFDLEDILEQSGMAEICTASDDAADSIIELTEALSEPEQVRMTDAEDDIVELKADDIADAPLALPGMEEDPAPEVAGALFPAASEAEEKPAGSEEVPVELNAADSDVPAEQAAPCVEPPHPAADEEREAFLSLAVEMEARLNELAARHEAEARVFEERLAAAEQRVAELDAFAEAQERRHSAERSALEERLAAAEQRNAVLEAKAAELEKQLEERSSFSLDDAAFRLGLEGMISAMLDARMASEAPIQDEPDEGACVEPADETVDATAPESIANTVPDESADEVMADVLDAEADGSSVAVRGDDARFAEEGAAELDEAFSARIIEIEERVGELGTRMAEWELRCEQEAARAASRVIREEIAALRADAARPGR